MDKPKQKRHFGDRKDGRRIRSIEPLSNVQPFIMPTRTGSSVYFNDSVEMTPILSFIHSKRKENMPGFGAMHVFISALVRTISQYPGINRFISGLRLFARNEIAINMTVKKELKLNAPETILKFNFNTDATVDDVYNEVQRQIIEFQNEEEKKSGFDKTAFLLGCIPRFFLKAAIKFLDWLDYHGKIPMKLLHVSPFHGTAFLTSMASLGIKPVYHHLYDFGNVSMFISFSASRHEKCFDKTGNEATKRFFDFKCVCDERICDGHYFATAFKALKKYLEHPEELNKRPKEIIEDID